MNIRKQKERVKEKKKRKDMNEHVTEQCISKIRLKSRRRTTYDEKSLYVSSPCMPHLEVTLEEAEANYCTADCASAEAACCALAREAAGSAKKVSELHRARATSNFSIFFFATFQLFAIFNSNVSIFYINIFKTDPQTKFRKIS